MIWTISRGATTCGSCRVDIATDDPVAVFTTSKLPRCVSCAGHMGFEVDWDQMEQARFALERAAIAHEHEPVNAAPARRLPPVRPPVPLSAIAGGLFDPKAAAAGRDD